MKLTSAQYRALAASRTSTPITGLLGYYSAGTGSGMGRASWERMMERLAKHGLVRPYVHGGYEITDAGIDALTEAEGGPIKLT